MDKLLKLGIEKIYCINLESRNDRWERMMKRFKKYNLEVERFNAITPSHPDIAKTRELKKVSNNDIYIACGLSHLKIWEDIIEKKYNKALILEDDNLFYENWIDILEKYVEKLNVDYDLIMLDGQSYYMNWTYGLNKIKNTLLANAYIVTNNSLTSMLKEYNDSDKFINHESLMMSLQNKDKSFLTMPHLCVQEMIDSDIQTKGHLDSLKSWHDKHYFPKFENKYE